LYTDVTEIATLVFLALTRSQASLYRLFITVHGSYDQLARQSRHHHGTFGRRSWLPDLSEDSLSRDQGAASGIGYATARLFLEAGVTGLTLVDISSDRLQAAAKELGVFASSHVLLVTADTSEEVRR
jgi:hypothetical protein